MGEERQGFSGSLGAGSDDEEEREEERGKEEEELERRVEQEETEGVQGGGEEEGGGDTEVGEVGEGAPPCFDIVFGGWWEWGSNDSRKRKQMGYQKIRIDSNL